MYKRILILLLALTFCGCIELVTDQFPEHDPVPVIYSTLVAGECVELNISFSSKLDSNDFVFVKYADVSLFANSQFIEKLEYNSEGNYSSEHLVQEECEYSCKITIPGYEDLEVSTYVPTKSCIKSIIQICEAGINEEGMIYPSVEVSFRNDPDKIQYFELSIKDIYWTSDTTMSDVWLINIIDPVILNEGIPESIFSNEIMGDSIYNMLLNIDTGSARRSGGELYMIYSDALQIELRSVSEEYYLFKKSQYLYEMGRWGDGIVTPMGSKSLYSNIENAYGIFSAYSATDPILVEPDTENYYE